MKNFYEIEKLITISEVDVNYNLRLDHMLNFLQDVTTFHSYEMGVDRETLVKNTNAFWVLTKIKLNFDQLPKWNEVATIKTYPTIASAIRFFREYSITTTSGANVLSKSEWCVLDATTMAIRRSNSIDYPTMEHLPPNPNAPEFCRLKELITDSDFCYNYKIMHTDIDCNKHTNNVVYSKMMLNAFTVDEYQQFKIKGIEINFLNQSYIGDVISVYKKKVDDGYYFEGKIQDKSIFISKLYI